MRRAVQLPLRNDLVPHPRPHRAGLTREVADDDFAVRLLPFLGLDVLDVDDVPRPRRGLAEDQRLGLSLDVPRIARAPLHPGPAESDRSRARKPTDLSRMPRPVDEHVEAIRPSTERVLLVVCEMDDAVAGAKLIDLLVLPRETRAAEDEDDL